MKRLLYIKLADTSFIRVDEEILKRHFVVKPFLLKTRPFLLFVLDLVRLKLFLLRHLPFSDGVFIRFADHYAAFIALFTMLFRKKLIIVSGGYDAVHIPEYNYGVYHSRLRGCCARFAFRHADLILPNNPTLVKNVNTYSNDYPRPEGILHFVPDTKARIQVVYNGFNPELWPADDAQRQANKVVTVAFVNDYRTYKLKGIDSFIELAHRMPDVRFAIAGLSAALVAELKLNIPSNLEVLPAVPHSELPAFYRSAKVFCLLSLTEGMPNVLCEAMLSGCIPVGTSVNAIPEVIGDTGFVIMKREIGEMEEKVRLALSASATLSKSARLRIAENFSLERREKELCEAINGL